MARFILCTIPGEELPLLVRFEQEPVTLEDLKSKVNSGHSYNYLVETFVKGIPVESEIEGEYTFEFDTDGAVKCRLEKIQQATEPAAKKACLMPECSSHLNIVDPEYSYIREKINKIKQKLKNEINPSKYRIATSPRFIEALSDEMIVIDKSDMLIKLFRSRSKAVMITTPRRWGKSFNLDLIRAFCELECDIDGRELPEDLKINRFLFENGAIDFATKKRTHFKVMEALDVVDEHFGRYIVIYLDLKNAFGNDYDEFIKSMAYTMSALYTKFNFLLKSDILRPFEKQSFEQYETVTTEPDPTMLMFSLKNLCSLLYSHYKEKHEVIVLIDEYDSPSNNSFYEFKDDDIMKTNNFMNGFLGCVVKGHEPPVYLSVLTGVLRLAKCYSASPMNNVDEYDIVHHGYSKFYGFTRPEVQSLVDFWPFTSKPVMSSLLKHWYDGYNFLGQRDTPVYNPFAVMLSLNKCIGGINTDPKAYFRSYWTESGQIDFMKPLFFNGTMLPKFYGLFDSISNKMQFNLKLLTYDDMKEIYQLRQQQINFDTVICSLTQQKIYSFLLFTGYFTVVHYDERSDNCVVRLANNEIREHMKGLIRSQIKVEFKSDFTSLNSCIDEYISCNEYNTHAAINKFTQKFAPLFHQFLKVLAPFEKIRQADPNQDLSHCLLVALVLYASFGSEVVNRNRTRSDILIVGHEMVIIIELKFDHSAEAASNQIVEKDYAAEYRATHDLCLVGLNVNKDKSVEMQVDFHSKDQGIHLQSTCTAPKLAD